ncbi:cytochrome P450 [Amylostereum chailletii]|nr:cytochrome P450 [Amylostereum chailletii]
MRSIRRRFTPPFVPAQSTEEDRGRGGKHTACNTILSTKTIPQVMTSIFSLSPLDWLALLAFVGAATWYISHRSRRFPTPPGPRPLPLVGNLFDIPKNNPWATYANWSKKYGDIVSVRVPGQTVVIVSSVKAVKDIFDRRGAVYSERPRLPILEMIGLYDWLYPLMPTGHRWKAGRRITEQGMRPAAVQRLHPVLETKAHQLLRLLAQDPAAFSDHIKYTTASTMLLLLYGRDAKTLDDDLLSLGGGLMAVLSDVALPGAHLVNNIPFLRHLPGWLPGMGFKALAAQGRLMSHRIIHDTYRHIKGQIENGTAGPCLVRDHLESIQEKESGVGSLPRDELLIKTSVASIYAPGSYTTGAALRTLFLALALHPEVQNQAQEEIDRVVGDGRLPTFEDRAALPYVDAVCKEVLRWKPPSPMSIPHGTAQDDVYEGYLIPKGAVVFGNAWCILHNPEAYKDPETFNPSRFIDADGSVIDDPNLIYAFGFGRRICPGRHLADSSFWMFAVSVLFAFRISPAKDDLGREIPLSQEFTDTLISQPKAFKCTIVPRSAWTRDLVENSEDRCAWPRLFAPSRKYIHHIQSDRP